MKRIGAGSWWVIGYGRTLSEQDYGCVIGTDTGSYNGGVTILPDRRRNRDAMWDRMMARWSADVEVGQIR